MKRGATSYDPFIVLLSLLAAIAASTVAVALGLAFHVRSDVSRPKSEYPRAHALAPRPTGAPSIDVLDVPSDSPSRLLLAEDNLVNQRVAVAVLERWGHSVDVVEDGRAVLAAVARQHFDAILMDVQMPTMDGLRATMEIRAGEQHAGGHLPIIAMTARTMTGDRERCLEAGMDAYVGKPFDLEELRHVLESILSRPASEQDSASRAEVLDAAALTKAVAGDQKLLRELVELFRVEGPRRLADLRVGLARGDATAVAFAAHSLKGSVGALRGPRSFEAALTVEALARRGELPTLERACAALEQEIARLQEALTTLAGDG